MSIQIDLASLMDEAKARKRSVASNPTNRASELGDPCLRYLVYSRTRGHEKLLPDVGMQYIWDEGTLHHDALLVQIRTELGLRVRGMERGWPPNPQNITGHIDAEIEDVDQKWKPLEIKTTSPYEFPKLPDNVMEFLKSKKRWMTRYPAQIMLYLYLSGCEEGVLLFKNKLSGQLKQINVALDYAYTETLLKKAEAIERHLKENTLPERVEDSSLHDSCPFYHICLPDTWTEGTYIEDPELEEKVNLMQELKGAVGPMEEQIEELKEEVKASMKGMETRLVGKWLLSNKLQHRDSYTVPAGDMYVLRVKDTQAVKAKKKKG